MQNIYKHLTSILISLLLFNEMSLGQFDLMQSGTNNDLNAVYFLDAKNGYAVGDSGTLVMTSDGGRHWEKLETETKERLLGVNFINPDTGFIIGENGVLEKTLNGGISWDKIQIPVQADLTAITFINKTTGFIIGHSIDGGVFVKTSDKGTTWSCKLINENCNNMKSNYTPGVDCDDLYLMNLSFLNDKEGLIGGYGFNYKTGKHPFVCKTSDGGNSFTNISPQTPNDEWNYSNEVISVNYMTTHDAYVIVNSGRGQSYLYISDYKIKNFKQDQHKNYYNHQELYSGSYFIDRYSGYFTSLVDGVAQVIKTIDLGESYMYLTPPTNNFLMSVWFTNNQNGYFVGQNGTIIHLFDENNVSYSDLKSGDPNLIDPPYTMAVPKNRTTVTQIFVYNVLVKNKEDLGIELYDRYGKNISIRKSRIKLYSDEVRIKIRTKDLTLGIYFYSVKRNDKTLVNGKLNIGSLAQLY